MTISNPIGLTTLSLSALCILACDRVSAQAGGPAPAIEDVESPIQPSAEHPWYWKYEGVRGAGSNWAAEAGILETNQS